EKLVAYSSQPYLNELTLDYINSLAQNSHVLQFWADVAYCEEDNKSSKNVHNLMNFVSGRFLLELKSCDDLVQLDDFKKLVNNMIEEYHKVIIQKTQEAHKKRIIQKWKEIAGNSSLFSSNSFDIFEDKFIQKNLLDSFYFKNEDFNNPETYSKEIMSKKKYHKKVDIAISYISYRVENVINNGVQYGYFYPILGEAKPPNINGDNDYNKLNLALNDNFDTIINHYSKKVKEISDDLLDLFSDIKLGGIHVTANISSSKILSKFEDQQAGYIIDFLYCVKIATNSTRDEFKKKMSRFEEFVSFFDEIIYGDDIEVMECRNKYQAVMNRMSLSPNKYIVIEDSSCRIYKAIEQNLKVIWIQDQKMKEYFDENYKDLYDDKNMYILKLLNEVYVRNLLQ
ncbi:15153_t:CDS:2, partial [Dentiscutata erythropus]